VRIVLAAVAVILPITVGAALIWAWHGWFWIALGVYLCGQGGCELAFHARLDRPREYFGGAMRIYQFSIVTYMVAGALVVAGALRTLDPPFAAIAVVGAATWIWGWSYVLRRIWRG
jgi:hypothetical protein